MQCYRCCSWPCDCHDGQTIIHGDCREVLPELDPVDLVLTDPPYGMNKAEWDTTVIEWLHLISSPKAVFCGVIGMRDYPLPDWIGAWVKPASTQRNGRFRGFNNWEPILFYQISCLSNDVFTCRNQPNQFGHPTEKPQQLFKMIICRMNANTVLDPFLGSGTTLRACKDLGRRGIGIEIDEQYCEIAANRLRQEVLQFS